MNMKSGIVGLALWGAVGSASAFTSSYSGLAMPSSENGWNTAPDFTLVADYTWQTQVAFSTNPVQFKFTANNSWDINWGGGFTLLRAPAKDVGPLVRSGDNLVLGGLSAGIYRVTFRENPASFDLTPLSFTPPAPSAVQVVGAFNNEGRTPAGEMTNTSTHVWKTTVELPGNADMAFLITQAGNSERWGAPLPASITALPFTGSPSGANNYIFQGIYGGTFE
ncbi:MAG: hypothetical protein LBN38_04845, partial [Verrucomicrobiota bacterium]|nr:hypothetical protein [Verrucomicrobiota bacterium]